MKNKTDILYILLITLYTFICFLLFSQNIYSPYSDIGREFYITEQLKQGAILYKDILNVYSPLGYWINTIITKILGNNLNIFYGIGLITTIFTLIPIYLISKIHTNKHISFILTILICSCCGFYPSISNWITPYSYSLIYALCTIIWSIYFFTKYTEENKKIYYLLSSLFLGISICFKYEYFFICIPLITYSIIKKIDKRTLLGIIIFPLICLVILIIQGCSIQDLIQAINKILRLSNSESVKYFYNFAGISLSINSVKTAIISLFNPHLKTLFYSITYINILFLIYATKIKNNRLIIILTFGLLASLKSIGGISLEIYGTFFLPLLLIGLIAALYNKPNKIKTFTLYLICTVLIFLYFNHSIQETNKLVFLNTKKGSCKIPYVYYDTTIKVLNLIEKEKEKEKKILILPEGAILNYLTNKESDNFLYYLIPPNKDILDETFIKNKIKEKNLESIFITNIQYPWYNEGSFMRTWGKTITETIKEDYTIETTIGEDFKFYIYKRDIIN